jgi:hypothetical protein
MAESYPVLSLEQVHGALAFYLANQKEIDGYIREGESADDAQYGKSRNANAYLIAKLRRARHENQIPG